MTRRGRPLAFTVAFVWLVSSCAAPAGQSTSRREPGPTPASAIALSVLGQAVYAVDPRTGGRTTLAERLGDFRAGFATWAPDHRRLAYSNRGIVVLDVRSRGLRRLIGGPSASMPSWSPRGDRIAYGDGRRLWITPTTGRPRPVPVRTPRAVAPLGVSWGANGTIAFQGLRLRCRPSLGCSSTARSDVWTVEPDGTAPTRLTSTGHAGAPKWSPEASRLLFVRIPDPRSGGAGELWTIGADGSQLRRLPLPRDVVAADWSPDGRRLALVREQPRQGRLQLWLARADGSHPEPVGTPFDGTAATVDW